MTILINGMNMELRKSLIHLKTARSLMVSHQRLSARTISTNSWLSSVESIIVPKFITIMVTNEEVSQLKLLSKFSLKSLEDMTLRIRCLIKRDSQQDILRTSSRTLKMFALLNSVLSENVCRLSSRAIWAKRTIKFL